MTDEEFERGVAKWFHLRPGTPIHEWLGMTYPEYVERTREVSHPTCSPSS